MHCNLWLASCVFIQRLVSNTQMKSSNLTQLNWTSVNKQTADNGDRFQNYLSDNCILISVSLAFAWKTTILYEVFL